jgi:hypothetical protein
MVFPWEVEENGGEATRDGTNHSSQLSIVHIDSLHGGDSFCCFATKT